jgi:hypothetical protein
VLDERAKPLAASATAGVNRTAADIARMGIMRLKIIAVLSCSGCSKKG